MGKSKSAQRTKGNVRPSSSGRSAELLGPNSKLGFVGFGVTKIGQHVSQESETDIDGMFSMVMKKMLKRDATTKLKAIQEYKDLICEKDKMTVLSILPFWPRLYNKLSLDFDRRIREATQDANAKLIDKVKRDIAPYLKNICGVWLLSQCDSYAPAASLSKSTFFATFPEEKQSEALMFCREQILAYFKENLFEHTPQTLSEQNIPIEEIENKYALVISGTLHGLRLFISTISAEDKQAVLENIKTFISENKFWKHGKSKNPQIRVAWYNLVSVLCQYMPGVFESYEHKLGCAVLGFLSDSDPAVSSAIWEAALHYVVSFRNCWDTIDVHKVVLPQLWALLKNGGKGNASLVYPCLLPFLSKLPPKVTRDKPRFFVDFFDCMIQSLFLENVKLSTMECNAIVTAYIECLQYVCLHYKEESSADNLVNELVCDQLVSLLEKSFTSQGSHLPVSKFFQVLSIFLQTLEVCISKESGLNCFQPILSQFWEFVFQICNDSLKSDDLTHCTNLVFLAYFVNCMFEPFNNVSKKKTKHKVRFSEENSDESDDSTAQPSSPSPLNLGQSFLFKFTVKLCRLLCSMLKEKFDTHCMRLLCETLMPAHSPSLFQAILRELGIPAEDSKAAPLLFFETYVFKWMKQEPLKNGMVQSLIDIAFIVCSCIDMKPAMDILDSCSQMESPLLINGLLRRCLSAPDDKLRCSWMKSKSSGSCILHLLKLVSDALVPDSSDAVLLKNLNVYSSTITSFFNSSASQEAAVDFEKSLLFIKETFEQYLALCDKRRLNSDVLCAMYNICQSILTNHKECWRLSVADELMTVLFNCCMIQNPTLSDELRSSLLMLSLKSIKHLPNWQDDYFGRKRFVYQAVTELHSFIMNRKPDEMLAPLLETVLLLLEELESLVKADDEDDESTNGDNLLCDVLNRIFLSEDEWTQLKAGLRLNIIPTYLEKKLFYPLPENETIPTPLESIPCYVFVAELVSEIIGKLFSRRTEKYSARLRAQFISQLPHLAWAFSYCESHGYLIEEDTDKYSYASALQKNYFKMFTLFTKEEVFEFLRILYIMCQENNFYWEIPFLNTLEIIQTLYSKDLAPFLESFLFYESDNEREHLIRQIIVQYLPSDAKVSYLKSTMEHLITTDNHLDLSLLSDLCCCLQDKDVLKSMDVHLFIENVLTNLLVHESALDFQVERNLLQSTLVIPFLGFVVENVPNLLSTTMWDHIFRYLVTSLEHCLRIKEKICVNAVDLVFGHRTFSFVCILLSMYSDESERDSFTAVQKACFGKLSNLVLILFYKLSDICNTAVPITKSIENFLTTVAHAIEFLPSESLIAAVLESVPQISSGSEAASNTEEIEFPLQNFLKFLTSGLRPVQQGSHTILIKSMCLLPSLLGTSEEINESGENTINKRLLPLIELLEYTTQILESMLSDIKIGECCLVLPKTDSYTYTLAYLFAWSEFLEFLAASSVQERSTYVEYLEKGNLFKSLLSNLFRLMPETLISSSKDQNVSQQDALKAIFAETPTISLLNSPSVQDIQHVACSTYYSTLKKMPAVVRMWWNNLDKCSTECVNKFTSKYVSSLLTTKEIQAIHESDLQFSNMTMRARYITREVIAAYTIDGSTLELSIQLPTNYPLGPVVIQDSGNVKIPKPEWRHWLMLLTAFLTYQNGTLLDGLLLWKKNIDKKFEGVEECMICFYILHSITAKLPERSCHTCKKKFHVDCIYKWFVSSNTSTCPLCRCYF